MKPGDDGRKNDEENFGDTASARHRCAAIVRAARHRPPPARSVSGSRLRCTASSAVNGRDALCMRA